MLLQNIEILPLSGAGRGGIFYREVPVGYENFFILNH
jgi:hypothetical protein